MKGGSICKTGEVLALDPLFTNGDRYTLGEDLEGSGKIFIDTDDELIAIKYFPEYNDRCINEGIILKRLNDSGFTPKYYGTYTCKDNLKPVYVVMDRIMGEDLLFLLTKYINIEKKNTETFDKVSNTIQFIIPYIDEIYRLYNLLMDRGIIQTDLYLQNIILGNDGRIYLIDFEFAKDVGEYIPFEYRLTLEQVLENLVTRKPTHKYNAYLTRTGLGKLKKYTKNTRRPYKSTKTHKKRKSSKGK
jgi:serine/threonine protein kinase